MVALISSDKVVIAVVVGIPLVAFALVALLTRPRIPRPAAAVASLVSAVLVGVALWAVFRPGQPSVASGAQLASLPRGAVTGPVVPSQAPPQTPASPLAPPCAPGGTTLEIAAQALAFDKDCLAAPADTAFEIVFDNREAGVPHNVEIFSDPSASRRLGGATDAGDFITGPKQVTYRVPALPAGQYFFRCDLHPPQMNGTFVVA